MKHINDVCIWHMIVNPTTKNFYDCRYRNSTCSRSHNRTAIKEFFELNPASWIDYVIQLFKFGKNRFNVYIPQAVEKHREYYMKLKEETMSLPIARRPKLPCYSIIDGTDCFHSATGKCIGEHDVSKVDAYYLSNPMMLVQTMLKRLEDLSNGWQRMDTRSRGIAENRMFAVKDKTLYWLESTFTGKKFVRTDLGNRAEKSWTETVMTEVLDGEQVTIKKLLGMVNKISELNYVEIINEIIETIRGCSVDVLGAVTTELVQKASFESKFVDIYCDLAAQLHELFPESFRNILHHIISTSKRSRMVALMASPENEELIAGFAGLFVFTSRLSGFHEIFQGDLTLMMSSCRRFPFFQSVAVGMFKYLNLELMSNETTAAKINEFKQLAIDNKWTKLRTFILNYLDE